MTKIVYPNLSAELARRQMTLEKLAELMNLSASCMSLKLTGKRKISLAEARKIKAILGVDVPLDELFDTLVVSK